MLRLHSFFPRRSCSLVWQRITAALVSFLGLLAFQTPVQAEPALVHAAARHVPAEVAAATRIGHMPPVPSMRVDFVLPLRNQDQLQDRLRRISDPNDPEYGRYLTPQQFADAYGPSMDDVNAVARYAERQGLSLRNVSGNRTLIEVAGPSAAVETAFGVKINNYQDATGRVFHAPDREPSFPAGIAGRIIGIAGLDDAEVFHTDLHSVPPASSMSALPEYARSIADAGHGPVNQLTPSEIQSIYDVPSIASPGSGQTLAVFELATYAPSDIAAYETAYDPNVPPVPLENILVDGYSGTGDNATEVALDIEMMIALCPYASKILVYETASNAKDEADQYAKIASDDLASIVSSSWDSAETGTTPTANAMSDYQSFEQMAMQGQSMFKSSGDTGAYHNGSTLSVGFAAGQPYVTAVGGTYLRDTSSYGYLSESAWSDPSDTGKSPLGTGGGGGISAWWPLPSYQADLATTANEASSTQRNVPDVSLFGDYDEGGYAVYSNGVLNSINGTSASSPLWAAFTALVNQGRAATGTPKIGFLNPAVYNLASDPATYAKDFHDIDDGSTNLYYPAVTGYDLATGLGSPQGAALYQDLVAYGAPSTPVWNAQDVAAAPDGTARILWTRSDGAAGVWIMSASDAQTTVGPTYGPYAGWMAKAVSVAGDGTSRVLWTNTNGMAGVWTFNAQGTETAIGTTYGPYSGWTAIDIATAPNGTSRVLWTNTNGQAGVWTFNATGTETTVGTTYGPYPGWTAKAVGAAGDGTARVLWTNTNGMAGVWSFNTADVETLIGTTYGPYAGWTAIDIGTCSDCASIVLWTNANGEAGVWTFSAADAETAIGTTYGPYTGYTAAALDAASDQSRVLWVNSSRAAGLWTFGASDAESVVGSVYGPF